MCMFVRHRLMFLQIFTLFFSFLRPTFRSYKPLDEELQKSSLPAAKPEDVEHLVDQELVQAADPPVIEEIVRKRKNKHIFCTIQFFNCSFPPFFFRICWI